MIDANALWHVVHAETLLHMLRRVRDGDDPDLVYLEEFANATHERHPGDGGAR